jgi:hypothetical protein
LTTLAIDVSGDNAVVLSASGDKMNWLEEAADRAPLALVWLAAVAVGFLIYFVPIVGLLDSLAE